MIRSGEWSITDSRDGQSYSTVVIGDQWWMAENLKYLPEVMAPTTGSTTVPHYYIYGYDGTDVDEAKAHIEETIHVYNERGVLYNWSAAMISCDEGWRLPTDNEQHELDFMFTAETCDPSRIWSDVNAWDCFPAGKKMKSLSYEGNNKSGFTAIRTGRRHSDGNFDAFTWSTVFWSSTENDSNSAWIRALSSNSDGVYRNRTGKTYGFSVRCLKE